MPKITNRYVNEITNCITGEVIATEKTYTVKTTNKLGTYGMINYDTGWHYQVKPMDFKLVIELHRFENARSYQININRDVRNKLMKNFDISDSQITLSLKRLMAQKVIKKVCRGCYVINPECVWSGSNDVREKKLALYESI